VGTKVVSQKNQTKSYEFSQQSKAKSAYINKENKTFYHPWDE
jgi:hypothetical protein